MKYFLIIFLSVFVVKSVSAQTDKQIDLTSKFIKESRWITVTLPKGYDSNKEKKYPVLYALDGEWIHEYAKGTVGFMSNDLIGHIPEMIIVSIPNTDRDRDLSVTLKQGDGFSDFVNFLEFEVLEYVKHKFRVNGFNIINGWSSGASISGYMMATRPHLFDAFIESGSGIGKRTSQFFREELPKQNYSKKFLYVSTEGIGPRREYLKRYQKVIEEVRPKSLTYKFEILEGMNHAEVLGEGLTKGLKFVFGGFKIPEETAMQGADTFIKYYKELDSKYNFDVIIPEGILNESAYNLHYDDKDDEAIKLLKHGLKIHPKTPNIPGNLGEIYKAMGDKNNATKYYSMAIEKCKKNSIHHRKFTSLLESVQ